jgi:hypothetical protein
MATVKVCQGAEDGNQKKRDKTQGNTEIGAFLNFTFYFFPLFGLTLAF